MSSLPTGAAPQRPTSWSGVAWPVALGGTTILLTSPHAEDVLLKPMTIPSLASYTGLSRRWLDMAASRADDPLPTLVRGKRRYVLYATFMQWFWDNYGPDGPRRGTDGADDDRGAINGG